MPAPARGVEACLPPVRSVACEPGAPAVQSSSRSSFRGVMKDRPLVCARATMPAPVGGPLRAALGLASECVAEDEASWCFRTLAWAA